ncbi:MAG: hypothetical protein CMO80_01520 [Verrucomicrobiales bacterium]|nr:hypothetical protein [Verrucomicrobiales bacterium]
MKSIRPMAWTLLAVAWLGHHPARGQDFPGDLSLAKLMIPGEEWVQAEKDLAVAISKPGFDAAICMTNVSGLGGDRAVLDSEEIGCGPVILISEAVDEETQTSSVGAGGGFEI